MVNRTVPKYTCRVVWCSGCNEHHQMLYKDQEHNDARHCQKGNNARLQSAALDVQAAYMIDGSAGVEHLTGCSTPWVGSKEL